MARTGRLTVARTILREAPNTERFGDLVLLGEMDRLGEWDRLGVTGAPGRTGAPGETGGVDMVIG